MYLTAFVGAWQYLLETTHHYYGQAGEYYGQFYEPNVHYAEPILAISGNHDGDILHPSVPALTAFVENFCAPEPHLTSEAGDSGRDAMTQPNVDWTLDTPFVTFIGLYTTTCVTRAGSTTAMSHIWWPELVATGISMP